MSSVRKLAVPGIIILAAALLIVILVTSRGGNPEEAAGSEGAPAEDSAPAGVVGEIIEPTPPATIDAERRDADDPLALGAIDAPVGLVMFSDFQCPFCALWTDQTLPELLPYVEAGELRIEWRDLAVFGADSLRAAEAAYAAGLQGKYVEFTRELFAAGEAPSAAELTDEALTGLAGDLGLDQERFDSDRGSPEVVSAVEANFAEGVDLGVFSTPAFLINGHPIVGAQPAEVFLEAIEGELAE